jgi:hypothetical protein
MHLIIRTSDNKTHTIAMPIRWQALSPCGKILAIHEAARHATQGRPFDILQARA